MLHNDPPVSTPPVDNSETIARIVMTLAQLADSRDWHAANVSRYAASIEELSQAAVDLGADPVRVRQAAGVL